MVFTVLLDSHIRRNSEEINNREKSKEKERREWERKYAKYIQQNIKLSF